MAAKYGVPGRGYADFAVLRGDPSDGLPGVPGIGEKSAAALVSRFGSLDGLIAALDSDSDAGFPAGARTKLAAARDYLAAAPAVARVRTDVPVPAHDDALPAEPADAGRAGRARRAVEPGLPAQPAARRAAGRDPLTASRPGALGVRS